MTRTIDTSGTILPRPQTRSRDPIRVAADSATPPVSGISAIWDAINGLREHMRGSLIQETGATLLSATSQILHFEVGIQPVDGKQHDTDWHIYYTLDAGSFTLTVRVYSAASVLESTTSTLVDTAEPAGGWGTLSDISITCDEAQKRIEVEVTAEDGGPAWEITSLCAYWERGRSEAHSGVHSDGWMGIDSIGGDADSPLSTHRLFQAHTNLRQQYQLSGGQFPSSSVRGSANTIRIPDKVWVWVPPGVSSITVAVRARENAAPTGGASLAMTTDEGASLSSPIVLTGVASHTWYRRTLAITLAGRVVEITVTEDDAWISSFCLYPAEATL